MTDTRTWTTKFILPLLFPSNLRVLDKTQCKFVNAYLTDINKPYLDDHVFLVYESNISPAFDELKEELLLHPNYYCHYSYKRDNVFYKVFAFTRDQGKNTDMNLMIKGFFSKVNYQTKIRLLLDNDCNLRSPEHKLLFGEDSLKLYFQQDVITEEDPPNDLKFKLQMMQEI